MPNKLPSKRKNPSHTHPSSSLSRKKLKTRHDNPSSLPWKTVSRPLASGLDGDDGILELEEVEGVEIFYEETDGGRVVRFNVIEDVDVDSALVSEPIPPPTKNEDNDQVLDEPLHLSIEETSTAPSDLEPETFDSENLLPNWHSYSLHPQLLRALHHNNFLAPTPIQAAAIPVALKQRDIVGVAQTGSGKTLAFGLPILHNLLYSASAPPPGKPQPHPTRRPVKALILAPTRELALQVSAHLNSCLNAVTEGDDVKGEGEEGGEGGADGGAGGGGKDGGGKVQTKGKGKGHGSGKVNGQGKVNGKGKGKGKEKSNPNTIPPAKKPPPRVSVAAIVGGMSTQKQRRILDRGVDVLVATPGRLWDIIQDDSTLTKNLNTLRFLVLDEADRMIESGHFVELDNILRLTMRESEDDEIPDEDAAMHVEHPDSDAENENDSKEKVAAHQMQMQTFIFSATLSKDLQRNVKRRSRPTKVNTNTKTKRKNQNRDEGPASTLDDLLLRLDFRDPDPEIIDLSPKGGVVSTLTEGKIECLSADKDVYLYYFLLRYPGRSLVFLSSIDGIRRLVPLMELLGIKAFGLHSGMGQRERLRSLDSFKSTPNSLLLCTDLASRGLDIPSITHVIHYQLPRSADLYVHRNGRTARGMKEGFSMFMCAPDERRVVWGVFAVLGRDPTEIHELPIDLSILDKLKARVRLARQIDSERHQIKKARYERNWMKKTAEAMEIELDGDFVSDPSDTETIPSKHYQKTQRAKTASLKAQLQKMLAQPLIARGVSTRYITSGSRPIVEDLIMETCNEKMVGLGRGGAGEDLLKARKKGKGKGRGKSEGESEGTVKEKVKEKVEEDEMEWTGVDI